MEFYFFYLSIKNQLLIFFCCTVVSPVDNLFNFLFLLAKIYVFRCKCMNEKPDTKTFEKMLKERYQLELFNIYNEKEQKKMQKKWNQFQIVIEPESSATDQ